MCQRNPPRRAEGGRIPRPRWVVGCGGKGGPPPHPPHFCMETILNFQSGINFENQYPLNTVSMLGHIFFSPPPHRRPQKKRSEALIIFIMIYIKDLDCCQLAGDQGGRKLLPFLRCRRTSPALQSTT